MRRAQRQGEKAGENFAMPHVSDSLNLGCLGKVPMCGKNSGMSCKALLHQISLAFPATFALPYGMDKIKMQRRIEGLHQWCQLHGLKWRSSVQPSTQEESAGIFSGETLCHGRSGTHDYKDLLVTKIPPSTDVYQHFLEFLDTQEMDAIVIPKGSVMQSVALDLAALEFVKAPARPPMETMEF